MKAFYFIPDSAKTAATQLRFAFGRPLENMSNADFVRAWCSVAYLFPGLHPDGHEDPDSGWPRVLRPFAAEAWRRAETNELPDEALYPSDAQWCGLFDQMQVHLPDETKRRVQLAAAYGDPRPL